MVPAAAVPDYSAYRVHIHMERPPVRILFVNACRAVVVHNVCYSFDTVLAHADNFHCSCNAIF